MFDVLVHASNYREPTHGMRYAADVAKAFDSSLTALFVSEPIMPVAPIGMMPMAPEFYTIAAQAASEAMKSEAAFRAWASSRGVTRFKWQVATGFFTGALASAANWHDVLVLESGPKSPWASVGTLGNVLVSCGLPCLVVPEDFHGSARFESVAIASHGSPEAIRATHAALPLLKRARRVVLLKGGVREAFHPASFSPEFTVEEHLQQHDVQFSVRNLEAAGDVEVSSEILQAAGEMSADVLVMGAYGRTRFSEWVLGGVTHHALENARLPLFMRH